jgi:tetratricopeptide (TPR) repeat protein
LVEPDANPRKMEPVHELRGAIALEQGHYAEAAEHFRQGNHENDIYIKYLLAKSLEGAGQTDEAMKLYQQVANYNFNDVYFALTRKEAMMKVGS